MQRLRLIHLCGLIMIHAASAQITSPTVQWQRTFGGTGEEEIHSAVATPDGGLLIAGYSMSGTNDLKTSPNFGLLNFWVIRVDSSGNRLWDKTYGGHPGDYLVSAAATADGGFILGGPSRSLPSGNKTAPSYGTNNIVDADYWIVKIDRDGNKLWDRSFGGIADDQLWNLQQTRDGGFVLAGYSRSPASGNKTASNFGNYDYWLVRTDSAGNKLWDRCYGGTDDDRLFSVAETEDGGFVLGGCSNSGTNGNKTAPSLNAYNAWVIRTDSEGNLLWDKCFGGGSHITKSINVSVAPDGSYAMATHEARKFRLYRIDTLGNTTGYHDYGGSSLQSVYELISLGHSGFLLVGESKSPADGTKTAPAFGETDYWIVRTDLAGNQLWDLSFGGTDIDRALTAVQTADGGFFFGGVSRSGADGNKTAPALGGLTDYWGVKVSPDCIKLRATVATSETNSPVTVYLSGPADTYLFEYSDDLGTWTPFVTNTVLGSSVSVTPPDGPATKRFFRARSRP